MKVFELVALLQAMPQDLEVRFGFDWHDGHFMHGLIEGVEIDEDLGAQVVLIHETA